MAESITFGPGGLLGVYITKPVDEINDEVLALIVKSPYWLHPSNREIELEAVKAEIDARKDSSAKAEGE